MSQYSNVSLATDKAHIVPQWALYCKSGLGGLNQVNGPLSLPLFRVSVADISIFTRCSKRNQYDILMIMGDL